MCRQMSDKLAKNPASLITGQEVGVPISMAYSGSIVENFPENLSRLQRDNLPRSGMKDAGVLVPRCWKSAAPLRTLYDANKQDGLDLDVGKKRRHPITLVRPQAIWWRPAWVFGQPRGLTYRFAQMLGDAAREWRQRDFWPGRSRVKLMTSNHCHPACHRRNRIGAHADSTRFRVRITKTARLEYDRPCPTCPGRAKAPCGRRRPRGGHGAGSSQPTTSCHRHDPTHAGRNTNVRTSAGKCD